MKPTWMGRYSDLLEKLVICFNVYSRYYNYESECDSFSGCKVSYAQIQVIEYVLINQEKKQKMAYVASQLGFLPSAFSKLVKRLMDKGLLEKNHFDDNKKDIILSVTDKGKEVYGFYAKSILQPTFKPMFEALSAFDDSQIEIFTNSLKLKNPKE